MSERSLYSPEGQKWLPWFRSIFDDGLNVAAERPAELVLALASGKADCLTGRFIAVADDLDAMIARAEAVERDELYALRLRKL